MPGLNAIKTYIPDTYYHVYNRGVNKESVFRFKADYHLFESLFERYLSKKVSKDGCGRDYPNYYGKLKLITYCLMPNHFHMLIKTEEDPRYLAKFMSSHQTSFTKIINKKYDRQGHLFQERYRAIHINNDKHFNYISSYILNNPSSITDPKKYPYSSYKYTRGKDSPDWIFAKTVFAN